jgi:hypothetical protein
MSARFAARLVVSVTPDDVGQRVSLRRRLATGAYSDVIGVLESWSRPGRDGVLCVRRRDGEVVEIPESVLAAGKVVPPAPPRRPRRRA